MALSAKRIVLWTVLIAAIVASWLPYFDLFNSLTWVGPLPLPLAWVLASNVVLTVCAAALYPLYFKPLSRALDEDSVKGAGHE